MKKLVNEVINEIFRQMTITMTLRLDVPVRPMDAKGLRDRWLILEVVFVGQCEVFICLGLLDYFSLFFPLAEMLIGLQMGCEFFKKSIFLTTFPLILLPFFPPFGFIIVCFFYILFIWIFQLFLR